MTLEVRKKGYIAPYCCKGVSSESSADQCSDLSVHPSHQGLGKTQIAGYLGMRSILVS